LSILNKVLFPTKFEIGCFIWIINLINKVKLDLKRTLIPHPSEINFLKENAHLLLPEQSRAWSSLFNLWKNSVIAYIFFPRPLSCLYFFSQLFL